MRYRLIGSNGRVYECERESDHDVIREGSGLTFEWGCSVEIYETTSNNPEDNELVARLQVISDAGHVLISKRPFHSPGA